uniref:Uncharacterized protein n=1 Tax=Arundo donax TaxID=35708 RepID=A0A0A9G7J2_ARUDO
MHNQRSSILKNIGGKGIRSGMHRCLTNKESERNKTRRDTYHIKKKAQSTVPSAAKDDKLQSTGKICMLLKVVIGCVLTIPCKKLNRRV